MNEVIEEVRRTHNDFARQKNKKVKKKKTVMVGYSTHKRRKRE